MGLMHVLSQHSKEGKTTDDYGGETRAYLIDAPSAIKKSG